MNLHTKLRINGWLWAGIAIPWSLFLLLRQFVDKAGHIWSDWSWFVYNAKLGQWSYCREVLAWDLLPPMVLGWVAQYLVIMTWHKLRGGPGAPASAS